MELIIGVEEWMQLLAVLKITDGLVGEIAVEENIETYLLLSITTSQERCHGHVKK